jgi:ABC-type antimicrobial peptide transport system permease subunit
MGFPVYNVVPWQGMLVAAVIGLAFGALAAIVPSRKAAGLQIVEALRYE